MPPRSRFNQTTFQLILFFTVTYTISWAVWLPAVWSGQSSRLLLIAGSFGPTLAALLLTAWGEGGAGLRRLLRRLLIWRVAPFWYLFSFFSTAIVVGLALSVERLLGGEVPPIDAPQPWYLLIIIFLYVLFFSVAGEELGWRGYALPKLQQRYSALYASLLIGLLWSLWHLPLFWMPGDFHQEIPISLFLLQSTALAILYTWLYNNSHGSLLLVHLFHTASNITLGVLPILPSATGGNLRPLWIAVALLWCVAGAVVALYGPGKLAGRAKAPLPEGMEPPRILKHR
jgi:uncharacterized protein